MCTFGKFATQAGLHGDQFFAELDARLAERFAQANHLCAEVVVSGDDTSPILGDLLGEEANLAADFGELAEDFVAQRVEASAETRDCLDHQIEAGAELLEDRANP